MLIYFSLATSPLLYFGTQGFVVPLKVLKSPFLYLGLLKAIGPEQLHIRTPAAI